MIEEVKVSRAYLNSLTDEIARLKGVVRSLEAEKEHLTDTVEAMNEELEQLRLERYD